MPAVPNKGYILKIVDGDPPAELFANAEVVIRKGKVIKNRYGPTGGTGEDVVREYGLSVVSWGVWK